MGYPVLMMNPKGGKMARKKKNPAGTLRKWGLGLLGATAAAAASYALEGTEMRKATVGAIQFVGSLGVGIPLSMAEDGLGTGVALGGSAIGIKTLGGELADYMAKPAPAGDNEETTSAIRARLGATRSRRANPRALPPRSINVSDVENIRRAFSAIRARIR